MKKLLTLLLSIGLFSATFAQGNHHKNEHYKKNDHYAASGNGQYHRENNGRYYQKRNVSYSNQRAEAIQRINRVYKYKVMSIQNNRYMKKHQKKLAIRDLQRERVQQIQMVNRRFNESAYNYQKQHHGRK